MQIDARQPLLDQLGDTAIRWGHVRSIVSGAHYAQAVGAGYVTESATSYAAISE
jgi:hypothetical protein